MTAQFYAILALALVWLVLFFMSRETRREMLIMSVLMLLAMPGTIWLAGTDVRSMEVFSGITITVDMLIFGALVGGIASVAYHIVFRKRVQKLKKSERKPIKPSAAHWLAHILIILAIWGFASVFLTFVFNINAAHTLIIGGIMVGLYIIADRKDLLMDALLSAVLMAVIIFLVEQIFVIRIFPEISSAAFFGSVPLEEIAWAAVVGFTFGPLYEYARQLKLS
ncbi:MAG: hypothetical protein ABIG32_01060 [Candidatus Uhrbacteria bacterium]|nr:hypothetical protein [Patescibacteria group bacterium]MBU1906900.1 hypothetical protein [Patescibacteria group bacterium]